MKIVAITGLLKHLFDLFEMTALQGKPVLIFATGKAEAHGEHVKAHLRSLMGFFKAEVCGDFIYAMDGDSPDSQPSAELRERVDRQLARTLAMVSSRRKT
ncbi:NAD(P)H-dependent oxidoreductase [Agrobacterium sp. CNPSo 2736]|uniref:NADPH-dependent FMN reductase n=1 Tax=Agrobacterium sp. CNPSo 2736 TaxID=2499627 RepID=UPI001FE1435C|nr:NAD(P)H-dependent oxidoreductase [Agrobacterium sp. CNPSo 2736]